MEWILLAVIVVVAFYAIGIYNNLVKLRQMVLEGWSGISVQLKRRADLIPNLVETVKGYASHEKETFETVTALRAQAEAMGDEHPAERAKVESQLSGALVKLLAVAEAYPDLKANQNFMELQASLEETENQIEMARRYYNGSVRNLNTSVGVFPNNLIAGQFGFQEAEYFELENPADREAPSVSFG